VNEEYKETIVTTIIKLILSILLFGCLLDWPYSYFQLVRYASFLGFGYLAIITIKNQSYTIVTNYRLFDPFNPLAYIYPLLAILFQPFFKIPLSRNWWTLIDVIIGFVFIWHVVFFFMQKKYYMEESNKTKEQKIKEALHLRQEKDKLINEKFFESKLKKNTFIITCVVYTIVYSFLARYEWSFYQNYISNLDVQENTLTEICLSLLIFGFGGWLPLIFLREFVLSELKKINIERIMNAIIYGFGATSLVVFIIDTIINFGTW